MYYSSQDPLNSTSLTNGPAMKPPFRILLVFALLAGAAFFLWLTLGKKAAGDLTLYGNVDQRQVELAFIDSERVADVLVEEGMCVAPGQVLARLETRRPPDAFSAPEPATTYPDAARPRL